MKGSVHVFRKEILEVVRDKRVLLSALLGPVLLVAVFVLLIGFVEREVSRGSGISVAIVGDIGDTLATQERLEFVPVPSVENGIAMLRDGEVRLVLEPQATEDASQASLVAHYDPAEPTSTIALGAMRQAVTELNKGELVKLLERNGLPASAAEPVLLEAESISDDDSVGASTIAGLLPYLIVIWAFYGGFALVTDLVAGEKEKRTMETLLVSPIARTAAALGKYGALCIVCFASGFSSLLAVLILGALKIPMTQAMFPQGNLISPLGLVAFLGVLVPLVLFFAALLILISTYSRSSREAQSYLTLVSFMVILPAVFSQFIGFTDMGRALWVKLTPVLNSAVVLRQALLDRVELVDFGATFIVNTVLAAICLLLTIRMFNQERILEST